MVRTKFFEDSDDDDDVAPPPTAPPAVPGPPSPLATATAGPSLAEVLASAHPSLAPELSEKARSIAQSWDNPMNIEVRQGDEDVPIGTHTTSAPPAPAASSRSTDATATLVDIDHAAGSRGRARAGRRSREEHAWLKEEREWEAFMGGPLSGGEDSELPPAPRYTGRDAEVLPETVSQRTSSGKSVFSVGSGAYRGGPYFQMKPFVRLRSSNVSVCCQNFKMHWLLLE